MFIKMFFNNVIIFCLLADWRLYNNVIKNVILNISCWPEMQEKMQMNKLIEFEQTEPKTHWLHSVYKILI